ncbi:hypothetical protein HYO03_08895 [Vibrio parahaemolyticus]|uniref:hypothetical protein n=1 Tax=Vibrio parahaemolyticus TaxID=670 RepID=UPI0005F0FDCE|nr:hypothetical protein [Vibrio parahaemolyticus]MBM5066163.1 hypothetical protein [Vibrio parahaemolyticus]MDG2647188.1 hypothetical protein [Vibrio parahaemolyticus]MDG3391356.1 hypothetical protein [Vibrio parahaemolyticus]MDG3401648.1 hypothetical protein [Vibrio parahaemolyticus]
MEFNFELIKPVVAAIESLYEAAKWHAKSISSDPETIELAMQLNNVLSKHKTELINEKKSLGKPPRPSRSKNPEKRSLNKAKRDTYFEQKAKLDDEIKTLSERQKGLSGPLDINDSVTIFSKIFDAMCNAKYQVASEGSMYIPSHQDVYKQLVFAFKHSYSLGLDCYAEWFQAVEWFKAHEYDADLIKIAFAYIAASTRAQQFPHNLSIDQVFDGFGEAPWEHQLAVHVQSNHIIPKQKAAINCTRLNKHGRMDIEHVSAVIDAATPSIRGASQVNNFYLSTPMGGVYNAKVNNQIYNSGSKTDGVLLPVICAGLKHAHYITVVVHRITLTHDIHKRVESYINEKLPNLKNKVWHYKDKVAFGNPRVLVVCVNSLTRPDIADFVSQSKVVIVDEFTQVLDNISNLLEGDGMENEVQKALTTFDILAGKIANNSTTFIALDADMDSKTIQLINKYTNTEAQTMVFNITHPECNLPLFQRSKQAIFHRDKNNMVQIKSTLQQWIGERIEEQKKATDNGRFFIAVDNKNLSVITELYCKTQGLRVCLINSDTTQAHENLGAYGLMKGTCKPEHFDVVIFSPSITSGVSWATPLFKKGIVIANKTIASGNLKQMLFRFRHTTLVHVFAQITPARESIPEHPIKKMLVESLAESAQFGPLYLEIRAHRREMEFQSTKHQRCFLAYQLDAEGWGYSVIDPTSQSSSDPQRYHSIKSNARTDAIMKSPLLNMQQYKHITNQYNNTNNTADIYAAIRFQSTVYGAVSDSKSDVMYWVSGAAEKAVCAIQAELLTIEDTLTLKVLDTCLTQCGFSDWKKSLECGEDINVPSAECLNFLLSCLEKQFDVNTLHALGIFDNGKESNRKRWIRTNGEPIKETAVVISHAKVKFSAPGSLLTDLSKKLTPPYKAIQLFDGNVLVINTKPKNCALGGAIIRKLLAIFGIPAQANDRSTLINGKKALSFINMAKRRLISQNIATKLAETSGPVRSIRLKCLSDTVGFDVKVYWDGEVRIVATPEVIELITKRKKLAAPEGVLSYSRVWGSITVLPHFKVGCSGNDASNLQEIHLIPETHKIEQSEIVCIDFPLSILDYVRLLLPSLLADPAIVESMLYNLDLEVITGI